MDAALPGPPSPSIPTCYRASSPFRTRVARLRTVRIFHVPPILFRKRVYRRWKSGQNWIALTQMTIRILRIARRLSCHHLSVPPTPPFCRAHNATGIRWVSSKLTNPCDSCSCPSTISTSQSSCQVIQELDHQSESRISQTRDCTILCTIPCLLIVTTNASPVNRTRNIFNLTHYRSSCSCY